METATELLKEAIAKYNSASKWYEQICIKRKSS